MDTSRLRQAIDHNLKEMIKLKNELAINEPMSRGLVYMLKRKCGKKPCRCQKGKLHSQTCLAWGEKGSKYLRPLKGQEEIDRYKKLTGSNRRFRNARTKFIKLSKKVVELSNKLEQAMLKTRKSSAVSGSVKNNMKEL